MNMGNLYRLSDAKTRSISPENFTGEKGKGGMANPSIRINRTLLMILAAVIWDRAGRLIPM